jgi:hypothetical protein
LHTLAGLFDGAVVDAKPVAHLLALVPRSVVPDQQQAANALCCQAFARPDQKVNRDRADGAPVHKAQQHLVGLLGSAAKEQPITGQGFGIAVVLGTGEFLERHNRVVVRPTMLVGLRQPAPPDFVGETECPGRVIGR